MLICPACGFENLPGNDECSECGVNLTLEDTNPEYKTESPIHNLITNPISSVELRQSVLVSPQTSVAKTIAQLIENRMGCALVVEKNEVVGIFTERDVIKRVTKHNFDLDEIEVKNLMTSSPEVLDESDSIAFALNKMAMGNFRHVPIRRKDGSFTFFGVKDALRHIF